MRHAEHGQRRWEHAGARLDGWTCVQGGESDIINTHATEHTDATAPPVSTNDGDDDSSNVNKDDASGEGMHEDSGTTAVYGGEGPHANDCKDELPAVAGSRNVVDDQAMGEQPVMMEGEAVAAPKARTPISPPTKAQKRALEEQQAFDAEVRKTMRRMKSGQDWRHRAAVREMHR